jgi:hypothetical protein
MARTQPTYRKDQAIVLVSTIPDVDPETQEPTETTAKRTVFAAKKSVWMREHYTAAAFDLRPEIVFVIWKREYNGEVLIETGTGENLKQYQLIRAYEPNREEIELICSGPGPRPRTR